MKIGVFSVRDVKSLTYGLPFFSPNFNTAIRSVQMEVNSNSDSILFRHPSDFSLYHLGVFDDDLGVFDVDDPVLVCCLDTLKDSAVNKPGLISEGNQIGTSEVA